MSFLKPALFNGSALSQRSSSSRQKIQSQKSLTFSAFALALSLSLTCCLSLSQPAFAYGDSVALTEQTLQTYQDGLLAEEAGNLEQALILYAQASRQAPQDPLIHLHMGNTLKAMHRYSEALVHYQQAYKLSPNDPTTLLNIGLTLEQLNEPKLAENALLSLQQKQPRFTYVEYHLARLSQLQNRPEQAIDHYNQFLMAYPNHYDAKRSLAKLYVSQRQPEQAIALFNSLQRQSPNDFSDHLTLAKAHNLNQSPAKALQVLQNLLNESDTPPHADVSAEIGFAHLALGQAGFAVNHFEQAAQQHPEDPNVRLGLSRTYLDLNQPAQAIPHLNYYLSQYPDDLPVKVNLAHAYVEAERFNDALGTQMTLLDALSLEPQTTQTQQTQVDLRQQKGLTHHRLGQLDQAISTYTALLKQQSTQAYLTPESRSTIQQNLALAHHQAGHIDDALHLYETAYANTPNPSPKLQDDMARAWLAKADSAINAKQFDQAATAIAKARGIASEDFTDTDMVEANLWAQQYHVFAQQQAQVKQPSPESIQQAHTLYRHAEKALLTVHEKAPNNTDISLQLANLYLNAPISLPETTRETASSTEGSATTPSVVSDSAPTETMANIPPATQADFYLNQALSQDPDNIQGLKLKAQWLIHHQHPEQALTLFQGHWDNLPTDKPAPYKAEFAYEFANTFRQLNQPEEATKWYQQATVQSPKYKEAYYNQAVVFGQQGKHTAAKQAYEKALAIDEHFAEARYGLAVTHDLLGNSLKAQSEYQQYLESNHSQYATAASKRLAELRPPIEEASTEAPKEAPENASKTEATQTTPVTQALTEQPETTAPTKAAMPTLNPGKTTIRIGGKRPFDINFNVKKVTATPPNQSPTLMIPKTTPATSSSPTASGEGLNTPLRTLYRAE
jgi:tetratricopeptide (TPR) repeat protein